MDDRHPRGAGGMADRSAGERGRPRSAAPGSSLDAFALDGDDDSWLERARLAEAADALGCIGEYELIREVSRGAQGVVYRARQPNTQRDVALKRLIAGSLATPAMRARFEREVEAAAGLRHANLVTVYGMEFIDGQPLLAMEWIDGEPIDRWALGKTGWRPTPQDRDGKSRRPIRQLLAVFVKVCDALHHAHVNGVIHRDVKPGNILVDAADEPHVLDFGLAKVTSQAADAANLTHTRDFVGTPAYASPEHARGDHAAVDARSDVYSLGVILYQMLTGRLPHSPDAGLHALLDAIQKAEPPRPSSLNANLNREIDAILLKALAKEPERRYQSVDAFAADVRRRLAGQPVLAHPPTAAYQLGKLLKRHRLPFAFAATVLLLIVTGGVVSLVLSLQLAQQRDRALDAEGAAQRRFDDVRGLARAMMFDVHEKLAPVAGATAAREALVRTALDYLDRLAAEAGDDAELLREIAAGYHRMGEVQGLRTMGSLGDLAGAMTSFKKMQDICRALHEAAPADADALDLLASSHRAMGDILTLMGRREDALQQYDRQIEIAQQLETAAPKTSRPPRHLYVALIQTAKLHHDLGDAPAALQSLEMAQSEVRRSLSAFPGHADLRRDLAIALALEGEWHRESHELSRAESCVREALELTEQLASEQPDNDQFRRDLAGRYEELGDLALARQEPEVALERFRANLAIQRELAEADPRNVVAQRDLSIAHEKIGDAALARGDGPAALAEYQQSARLSADLADRQPDSASQQRDACVIRTKLAGALLATGRQEDAADALKLNLEQLGALIDRGAADIEAFRSQLQSYQLLADALAALGLPDESREALAAYHAAADGYRDEFPTLDWPHRHYGVVAWKLAAWHESAARDASRPVADRFADLRAARDWFERGRASAVAMRDLGLLRPAEMKIPALFDADVARCDQVIAALAESVSDGTSTEAGSGSPP